MNCEHEWFYWNIVKIPEMKFNFVTDKLEPDDFVCTRTIPKRNCEKCKIEQTLENGEWKDGS
jgi:hypothetical protein